MAAIDSAFDCAKALIADVTPRIANVLSEEDAKLQLICRFLIEVLGWNHADMSAERKTDNGYSDYVISMNGTAVMLVEAKRRGKIIMNTSVAKKGAYKISGPVLKAAMDGIEQAASYALPEGIPLSVLTDGEKWIFFKSFTLGANYKEKEAIVFPCLDEILEGFSEFYEIASKTGHGTGQYKVIFDGIHGNRTLLTTGLFAAYSGDDLRPIHKTPLAFDLERVFERFFSHLVGAEDPDLLISCFVETRESRLADFSLEKLLTNVLGNFNPSAVDVGIDLSSAIEGAVTRHEGETIFIVGPTGSGKTTFLDRFFRKTLSETIRKHCLVVNINSLDASGSKENILSWITEQAIENLEAAMFGKEGAEWDELRALYYGEYLKRRRGVDAKLYESDPKAFRVKFSAYLDEQIQKDREGYLKRLLKDAVDNRKTLPVFVVDNTDEFDLDFKTNVFQYFQSIRRHAAYCLLIFPVTDKSAWSFSKTEIFNIYASRSFFLPTPSPREVFRKRIEYLRQKLDRKGLGVPRGEYDVGRSLRLSIDNLGAFASSIEDIFVDHESTAGWVGELANYNIRNTLTLARRIITSPEMKVEALLASYVAGKAGVPSSARIMRALIKGDYNLYRRDDRHSIFPIFNVDDRVRQSPLMNLRILALLSSVHRAGENVEAKCLSVDSIISYFDAMGYSEIAVERGLAALFAASLLESYDSSEKSVSRSLRLSVSHSGLAHLDLSLFNAVFFEQMAATCRLSDADVAKEIRRLLESAEPERPRLRKARAAFVKFLLAEDARFGTVPTTESYDCQRVIATDLLRYIDLEADPTVSRSAESNTKVEGVVEWFDSHKGYGFLTLDGEYSQAFLHVTVLEAAHIKEIHDGDIVECDLGQGQKGVVVTRVHKVSRAAAPISGFSKAIVVKLARDRHYGFVHVPTVKADAFFHFSVAPPELLGALELGESVEVELNEDPKGRGFQVRRMQSSAS